jgi:hypothetical protein
MKKPKSQSARILAHLLSGKSLTAMQALDKFQCFRLAARIENLRSSQGWPITTTMEIRNGKRIAAYRITP